MKKYLIIVVVIILAAVAVFWVKNKVTSPTVPTGGVACTMEAKQCPDGSYVGRTGPKCDFVACPSPDDKVLDIKEWNIKMKLNDQIKDLSYKVVNGDSVDLISSDLIPTYNCIPLDRKGFIGSISRYAENPLDRPANMIIPPKESVKKVGNYYYVFAHAQDICSSNATLEYSKIDEVTSAIQTLMASSN